MEDSRPETIEHIAQVRKFIRIILWKLSDRSVEHDMSKLVEPEVSIFNEYTPKLKNCTYGSDEYKSFLKEMQIALDHHYYVNRHHPEHFENIVDSGQSKDLISCMNLVDIVEMLCDWKAATLRHEDGDILKSIEINKKRFNISDQLVNILRNTVELFE